MKRSGALLAILFVPLGLVPAPRAEESPKSCFLLFEMGVGEVLREPSEGCGTRVSPASTFKIPHALEALDSGVIENSETVLRYDGSDRPFAAWKRDHTLASAVHYSVVWYFQRIAERLGRAREAEYLARFDYGNRDSTSGLTTFWLGGSLRISPDEQMRFLVKLYRDELPVERGAMKAVREMLVQPQGKVMNALGEHAFGGTWPEGTVLSAKTGNATDGEGRAARWLVGHVARGGRSWIFVSSASGTDVPATAALDLAERRLRDEGLLGAPSGSR